MKERKFLTSALFIAAAAMSFGVVSAQATDHEIGDGGLVTGGNSDNFTNDSFIISSGTIDSSTWGTTDHLGAWIVWAGVADNNNGGSLGTTTITGEGFLGLAVRYGGKDYHADLTNVDASGFTGQLTVVNTFARLTEVQLKGEGWAGVEYVFGGVTTEWANASGSSSDSVPYYRGIADTSTDTLALQGDTTLAGVTGTSKGFTVSGYDVNSMEFITAAANDIVLTIAGTGEYEFYGTVGAEDLELSISMGYASGNDAGGDVGSQTFGGTNYLDNVTVNEGTLKLGGTTSISGSVSVAADAELDISGTVTLGSAIQNSGTVVVDSSVTFVLDNLTPSGSDNTYTYTIISGGTIEGWGSLDYSNFSGVTSDRQINISTSGQVTIDTNESAHDLTWSGSSGSTWNNNVSDNNVWTNSDTSSPDYFVNGDNVTFSGSGSEITISGNVKAGTMAVSGSYTFTNSDDSTLTVDSVSVTGGVITVTLTGGKFTIGSYVQSSGSDTASAFVIGDNTTVTMESFHANWHQTTTLGDGAVWTVTTELWYSTNSTEVITGGTINAQRLTISNVATIAQFSKGHLNIGSDGLKSDSERGYFAFGDDLTVGVWEGTNGTNTSWSSNGVAIQFVGTGDGTTFYTEAGQTITLAGNVSGVGFTNTGEGTLVLSGSVALSGAIINSGNIEISSSVSFAVDDLTVKAYTDGKTSYYEIITGADGANVTFDGGSYTNFTLDGDTLSSNWNIYTTDGYLVIYRTANDLTWAGTDNNHNWNYDDANWSDGGSTTFAEGDNVTFGAIASGSPYYEVDITTDITAGSVTVDGDYTFVFTDGITLEATSLGVAEEKTLKLGLAENATSATFEVGQSFDNFFTGSEGTIEIGEGITLELATLENNSASVNSANYGATVTGTGTLSVGAGGQIGLYLPDFKGTVIFREGTTYVRFGFEPSRNNGYTGVFNAGATLVFESGVGINIESDLTLTGEGDEQVDHTVSASIIFKANEEGTTGSHTIETNAYTAEFSGMISAESGTNILISSGGTLIFSGNTDIAGTVVMGSSGQTVKFSGSGTHSIATLESDTTGTMHLDFSGLTEDGSLTIGTLDFVHTGTLEIKGNTSGTGTITTVNFNMAGTLSITEGIVNVGSLTDNDQGGHAATVTIAAGSILSVGSMEFATGSAASVCSKFSGVATGDDSVNAGTLIVNSLTIGNDKTGAATEIKDLTFITGGVSFGTQSNSSFYLFLDNVEWGFTRSTTIAAATGGTSRIEIGDKTSGSLGTTSEATKTTINTNQYSTDNYTFTDTGLTITIEAVIAGTGALEVTGVGKLVLAAANEYSGGTTIKEGATVVAQDGSALGSGDVKVDGTLQVDTHLTVSDGTVEFSEAGKLIVTQTLLATAGELEEGQKEAVAVITANTITFGTEELSEGDVTELVSNYITVESGDYRVTGWYYYNNTLYACVIPEPGMFSMLFGLGAIGLVATRRRRREAA